jgi:hypothetical protein
MDSGHLQVLGVRVRELPVTGDDLALDPIELKLRLTLSDGVRSFDERR